MLCGTPNNLRAHVSSKCLAAGKHVYCEKPLTHNIWEARTIARPKASGLATQMGNQGHSTAGMRETCEWIWSGAIGSVREVHAWVSGNRWNPTLTAQPVSAGKSNGSDSVVPAGLNWDLWQEPRQPRPFHKRLYFPVASHRLLGFWQFEHWRFRLSRSRCGLLGIDLKNPTWIDFASAGQTDGNIGPHGCIGYYDFPANAKHPAVKVTWYDGGLKPPKPEGWPTEQALPSRGVLFIGKAAHYFVVELVERQNWCRKAAWPISRNQSPP